MQMRGSVFKIMSVRFYCVTTSWLHKYLMDFKGYVARLFKALSILKVFSLTIHDSTQLNRKTIIITKVFSFL